MHKSRILDLSGKWLAAFDKNNTGKQDEWFVKGPAVDAIETEVPGVVDKTFFYSGGVFWYWKEFDFETPRLEDKIIFKFNAVEYFSEIWLNGHEVGSHEGAEDPFELDITGYLSPDGKNMLTVRVVNPDMEAVDGFHFTEVPKGHKVYWMDGDLNQNQAGIWQPVQIIKMPRIHISDVYVKASPKSSEVTSEITIENSYCEASAAQINVDIFHKTAGTLETSVDKHISLNLHSNKIIIKVKIQQPHLWSLEDPYLYVVNVKVTSSIGCDAKVCCFGFREFIYENGCFKLNGKSILLKGTTFWGEYPINQLLPPDAGMTKLELINLKSMGFNMLRCHIHMGFPNQLDLCDEIGLLVLEECNAAFPSRLAEEKWTPEMIKRISGSVKSMLLRDRNHPSIVAWGLINECKDGPIFRSMVDVLPELRRFDPTRIMFINSGRWDGDLSIGSISSAGSDVWDCYLGYENPEGIKPDGMQWIKSGPWDNIAEFMGDIHKYVFRPWDEEAKDFFRNYGENGKGVFLSEFGNGSHLDPYKILRCFEQYEANPNQSQYRAYKSLADRLEYDWNNWRLDKVYPHPSLMINEAECLSADYWKYIFDILRSNPNIAGFCITEMADIGFQGSGIMTVFRDVKSGVYEALRHSLKSFHLSLITEPTHIYRGENITIEGILAVEEVLKPGKYPFKVKIVSPDALFWEKEFVLNVEGDNGVHSAVYPIFREKICLDGPAGKNRIYAYCESGIEVSSEKFVYTSEVEKYNILNRGDAVKVWETGGDLQELFKKKGIAVERFDPGDGLKGAKLLLIGELKDKVSSEIYTTLLDEVYKGAIAVFLSPVTVEMSDVISMIPYSGGMKIEQSGACWWGRDDVIMPHPLFNGLPNRCLMDMVFYRDIVPHISYSNITSDCEVIVPSFSIGGAIFKDYKGYWSGANLMVQRHGSGMILFSTLKLIENLGRHPAADRIMLNIINWTINQKEEE